VPIVSIRAPAQGADEPRQLAAVPRHVGAQHILRRVLDVVAERLDPRPVRDAEVFLAASVQHRGAAGVDLERRVRGEPRLADPGLAR
jgi:hypothetical protein